MAINRNNKPTITTMKLQLNENIEVKIYAKRKWNLTQIEISESEEYEFSTKGLWKDLTIKTDADGYTNWYMHLFDRAKRARRYKWFSLIGSLNQIKDDYFLIGKNNRIYFEKSGSLYCFANDANWFYWNNYGYITLKVTRIK